MLNRALVVFVAVGAVALATAAFIDDPEEFVRQSGSGSGNFLCSSWLPAPLQSRGCYYFCIFFQSHIPSSENVACVNGTCDCYSSADQRL